MNFLANGTLVADFSVDVEANSIIESELIAEAWADGTIKDCEIVMIIGNGKEVKLRVHNHYVEEITSEEIEDDKIKKDCQTTAIA